MNSAKLSLLNDAELSLFIEAKKKSIAATIFLNLFLPGAGYIYCDRWLNGITAFLFAIVAWKSGSVLAVITLIFIFVGDGFLCVKKYNRILIENTLKERATAKEFLQDN